MQRRRWTTRIVIVVLIVVAVWVLFTMVFPWVDRHLNDPVLSVAGTGMPVVTQEHARCRVVGSPATVGRMHGRPAECIH